MKNKFVLLLFALVFGVTQAQMREKDYSNILKSTNIYEINAFLRDAHPHDPRRDVLKPRVMILMKDYIKNAKEGDQRVKEFQEMLALLKRRPSTKITFAEMNENIRKKIIAKYRAVQEGKQPFINKIPQANLRPAVVSDADAAKIKDIETSEFESLMNESAATKNQKTANILTSLFDNDPNSTDAIVMIENHSPCNMIMRLEGIGNNKYRIAVPAKSENSQVVKKGSYLFSALVCGAQYASQKTVQQATIVALGNK